MSKIEWLEIETNGEGFIAITQQIQSLIPSQFVGYVLIQNTHTSCALTINESYDPLACRDMENFLKHLAPENLKFIQHTDEGPDDSPSHMKSILLNQSLSVIIENGKLLLGTWQGIYLCEFRRAPKRRRIAIKLIPG